MSRLHNVMHFIAKHILYHTVSIVFTQLLSTHVSIIHRHRPTIDINSPLTCASVSCVLLVLSDL